MKKAFLILIIIPISFFSTAQIKAVTENGDEVILHDSGQWSYIDKEIISNKKIPISSKVFTRDKESKFLVKSSKFNVGTYLNAKKWSFKKADTGEASEYSFELKDEDLYAMMITEKIEIELEQMRSIALINAKSVAPDVKITNEEYRNVNGLKVLHLQMEGTIQGIKFIYYGYYYSNKNGTVQFMAYTSQNLLKTYLPEIELLLNGFIEINN